MIHGRTFSHDGHRFVIRPIPEGIVLTLLLEGGLGEYPRNVVWPTHRLPSKDEVTAMATYILSVYLQEALEADLRMATMRTASSYIESLSL